MKLIPLRRHPAALPPDGLDVAAAVRRGGDGGLRVDYRIEQALTLLWLPPAAAPLRRNELWRHTCCEAFIIPATGTAYREFNFSPSGSWAVYDFTDYRQSMTSPLLDTSPRIACRRDGDDLWLSAELPAALLPAGAARLGLCMIAETAAGDMSYWALTHAGARPDFHLAASFTLALP